LGRLHGENPHEFAHFSSSAIYRVAQKK